MKGVALPRHQSFELPGKIDCRRTCRTLGRLCCWCDSRDRLGDFRSGFQEGRMGARLTWAVGMMEDALREISLSLRSRGSSKTWLLGLYTAI